jgi:hypothetical protein
MDEKEKNRMDTLENLRAAAYQSFNDRRSYEWKMCISIWTPFALYIGALVTQPIESGKNLPLAGTPLAIGTALVSLIILIIQVFWTLGLARANKLDNMYDWDLRNEMYAALEHKTPPDVIKDVDKIKKQRGKLWHWSTRTELLLTLLLGIVATIAAIARHA